MKLEPLYWLIALGILVVVEIITMGLTTIWFAGGALVAFVAGICGAPVFLQVVLFLLVSVLLLIFTRPVAEKHFNHNRAKTNVDNLIGKQCRVIEEIDNFTQTGKIMLNGMEWMARSAGEEKIPLEARVEVKEIKGAHAVVELVK